MFVTPIKCQGKKTKLVEWIHSIVENVNYDRWIEPFMGSGMVGFNMPNSPKLFNDINPHIIKFYQAISDNIVNENSVRNYLEFEGNNLQQAKDARKYYEMIRNRFNKNYDSFDFLFLTRSCFNGLMRFSSRGFNSPFGKNANRFNETHITKICNQIKECKKGFVDCQFMCEDFDKIISLAKPNDLIYCDPPYSGLSSTYFDKWNVENDERLFKALVSSGSKFIISSWLSTSNKKNEMIDKLYSNYYILTKEHFYQVGPKVENRHNVIEVLITNFKV